MRRATRFLFAILVVIAAPVRAQLPASLSDSAFWKLVNDLSEPGGYFRSNNFVSNETTYQWVIPELQRRTRPDGVYLGVGPDQNFTYIIALRPKIAFIFDIRRQNMLTHLMYKALFEASADRAEFLSLLFSRPRPAGVDTLATPDALFAAYAAVAPDTIAFRKNLAAIDERLTKRHGFALSDDDLETIKYVYESFATYGPGITYSSGTQNGRYPRYMPSFVDMQVASDSARVQRSYLATEANFRALKAMEEKNLIVPLVGDFAGQKAIRAVGNYLRQNNATVTAFYLSNVEQYLFNQNDDAPKFFANVGTLPLDSASTFIRSVFNGMGYRGGGYGGARSEQLLAPMQAQVKAFNEGKIRYYYDIVRP